MAGDFPANCTVCCSSARASTRWRRPDARVFTAWLRATPQGSARAWRRCWNAGGLAPCARRWRSCAGSIVGAARESARTSKDSPDGESIHVVIVLGLAGFQIALHLDPLAQLAQVTLAADGLLRILNMSAADPCVRIEAARAHALHGQPGVLAARRRGFDGQWRAFQRLPGETHIDPFDSRITTLVVNDLRRTTPVGGRRQGLVFCIVSHGASMT